VLLEQCLKQALEALFRGIMVGAGGASGASVAPASWIAAR
jgi:hypothetical protein